MKDVPQAEPVAGGPPGEPARAGSEPADVVVGSGLESAARADVRSGDPRPTSGGAQRARPVGVVPREETPARPAEPSTPVPRQRSSGRAKAATLILCLNEEVASVVLQQLDDEELGALTSAAAELGGLDLERVTEAAREFFELRSLGGILEKDTVASLTRLVRKAFPAGRANRILAESGGGDRRPFASFRELDPALILETLAPEHPQTIAVVLVHLDPSKAAAVLERLPPEARRETLERIAQIDDVSPQALQHIEVGLRRQVEASRTQPPRSAGGIQMAADILRAAGGGQDALLEDLEAGQPDVAQEVLRCLLSLEDLAKLDHRTLQRVVRGADIHDLALVLSGAPAELRERLLSTLSRRVAEQVRAESPAAASASGPEARRAEQRVLRFVWTRLQRLSRPSRSVGERLGILRRASS